MISLCTAICTHHKPQKGALSPGHHRPGGQLGGHEILLVDPGEESRWRLRGRRWSGTRRRATSKTNIRLETGRVVFWLEICRENRHRGLAYRKTAASYGRLAGRDSAARQFQILVIFSTKLAEDLHSACDSSPTAAGFRSAAGCGWKIRWSPRVKRFEICGAFDLSRRSSLGVGTGGIWGTDWNLHLQVHYLFFVGEADHLREGWTKECLKLIFLCACITGLMLFRFYVRTYHPHL